MTSEYLKARPDGTCGDRSPAVAVGEMDASVSSTGILLDDKRTLLGDAMNERARGMENCPFSKRGFTLMSGALRAIWGLTAKCDRTASG